MAAKGIPKLDNQFHVCGRKHHYDSLTEAMLMAGIRNKKLGAGTLRAYECLTHPGGFIIGHTEPQIYSKGTFPERKHG